VKTISLKKVSAVAVASLGFGLLSVVPAQAAAVAVTLPTVSAATANVAVGSTTSITFGGTLATADDNSAVGVLWTLTSVPTQSTVSLTDFDGAGASTDDLLTSTGIPSDIDTWSNNTSSGNITAASNSASDISGARTLGTLQVKPDVPGTYVFTLSGVAAANGSADAAADVTFTVFAGNFIDTDTTTNTSKNLTCTVGATITGTTCAGVAGGRVGVLFNNLTLGTAATYFVTATGGSIASTVARSSNAGTDLTTTNTNASNLNDGVTIAQASSGVTASEGVEILVTRADAGSTTIKVESFNATTGIRETVATGTVTFGSATALDIASVTVYGVANSTCDSTITASTTTYVSKTASSGIHLCIVSKNGAGTIVPAALAVVGNGTGLVGGAAVASVAIGSSDGTDSLAITGNGLSGTGKFTVTATDANSKVATGSIEIKYFDSVASIAITQTKWGIKDGVASYDNTSIATFSAKDKNGFPVAFGTAGAGDLVVDSDVASTQTIAKAGDNDSSATETLAASTVSALGVETAGTITVDVSSTMEKVTLKIHNSDNTVASNTITYFATTDAFESLVVGAVNGNAGTSQDVTATGVAKITGKTGYIIADSATATFFATAGTLSSTSAVNFKNGVATVSFATPLLGGDLTIKATPSETATVASASKAIKVTDANQTSILTQIDALNAKIVALNALIAKIMKKLGVR
jgi:hypothetical protein